MSVSKKLVVANWKMNPGTHAEAERLVRGIVGEIQGRSKASVILCPPFTWLTDFSHKVRYVNFSWGAQDIFWEDRGAYTGEISPMMLKSSGVKYVIVGHSERRKWLHETDDMVNKKVLAALRAGLKVILCVGEPLAVRRKGFAAAKLFVSNQLKKDLKNASSLNPQASSLVIAYEPIWAISGGQYGHKTDNPEETVKMVRFIKMVSSVMCHVSGVRVLYGGSINSKNAEKFFKHEEIGGALIGGASLMPKDFVKICKIASKP